MFRNRYKMKDWEILDDEKGWETLKRTYATWVDAGYERNITGYIQGAGIPDGFGVYIRLSPYEPFLHGGVCQTISDAIKKCDKTYRKWVLSLAEGVKK